MKTRFYSNVDGFSLIEVMTVAAIAAVVTATAVAVMPGFLSQGRSDGGSAQVLNALRLARERAIGERRNIEVRFIGNNEIQTVRDEISAGGVAAGTTTVADIYVESQQFRQFSGLGDTPDSFGSSGPIALGASPTHMFTSEGTFIDSSGDVLNGTIFLGSPSGDKLSARAITILGSTALLHTWKWNGRAWID
jgi:prepilin-type N-terminal cleavage/methylation domain-containing protein